MRSCENLNWTIEKNGAYSYEQAQLAVLMDIREYLKFIHNILNCQNALEIPHFLKRIERNTRCPSAIKKRGKK